LEELFEGVLDHQLQTEEGEKGGESDGVVFGRDKVHSQHEGVGDDGQGRYVVDDSAPVG
jgi:hypothetical protein